MSARVLRYLHEMLTALDLALINHFPRRELDRGAANRFPTRHLFGPVDATLGSNTETPSLPYVPFGLEATVGGIFFGSPTIAVSAGSMHALAAVVGTETRPGSWSGAVESDDWISGIHVLPVATSVVPVPNISVGSPTTGVEWWLVYVTPVEATVESNTQVPVFDTSVGGPTSGTYVLTSLPKVVQRQLTLAVIRGAANGPIPAIPTYTTPSGAVPCPVIAMLSVPSGATDLSNALIYDTRRLPVEGPNEIVEGCWQCPVVGQASSALAIGWLGSVTARISGEFVSVRSTGIAIVSMLDPSAFWDPTVNNVAGTKASLAFVYLCKVSGMVPRLRRKANVPYGSTYDATQGAMTEGILVISPVPPRIGNTRVGGAIVTAAGSRWDLRPSGTLGLPAPFTGTTASPNDCLCIGAIGYSAVASNQPLLYGPIAVDPDGWMRGEGVSFQQFVAYTAVSGGAVTTPLGYVGASTSGIGSSVVPFQVFGGPVTYGTPAQVLGVGATFPLGTDLAGATLIFTYDIFPTITVTFTSGTFTLASVISQINTVLILAYAGPGGQLLLRDPVLTGPSSMFTIGNGTANAQLGFTNGEIGVGVSYGPLPFDAGEVVVSLHAVLGTPVSGASVIWDNTLTGMTEFMTYNSANGSGGSIGDPTTDQYLVRPVQASLPNPGASLFGFVSQPTSSMAKGKMSSPLNTLASATVFPTMVGYRWPWRRALVT